MEGKGVVCGDGDWGEGDDLIGLWLGNDYVSGYGTGIGIGIGREWVWGVGLCLYEIRSVSFIVAVRLLSWRANASIFSL